MFIYIALFPGEVQRLVHSFCKQAVHKFTNICYYYCCCFHSFIQVDLKILLGLFGVLIVLLAVGASVGFLSYIGIEGSLIILEVVPFLVLAVGVDNLFIMVHSYEVCS